MVLSKTPGDRRSLLARQPARRRSPALAQPRRAARVRAPDSLILHYTGMPTADARLSRCFAIPPRKSPATMSSTRAGRFVQLVPEARRAWHAGVSCWRGERDMNSASIGIEICNPGHDGGLPPFPRPADRGRSSRSAATSRAAARSRPERVLAHSDIAPARKRDPGEKFPWASACARGRRPLGRCGAAVIEPLFRACAGGAAGARPASAAVALRLRPRRRPASTTRARETVVTAFQRHFRPARVDGEADASTVDALRRLIVNLSPGSA